MSGKRSRNKGANGEREFARLVQSYGFDCERTGRNGRTAEDVTHSVPGWHFEVKRRETLCVPEWVRQAHADADGLVPAVGFRRNRTTPADPLGQWHAIQPCADLFRLLAEVRDLRAEVDALQQHLASARHHLDCIDTSDDAISEDALGTDVVRAWAAKSEIEEAIAAVARAADHHSTPRESGD